jgi:hypothetical protein
VFENLKPYLVERWLEAKRKAGEPEEERLPLVSS